MKISKTIFIITSIFICLLASCKKDNKDEINEKEPLDLSYEKATHTWYYFSPNNFVEVEKPELSPYKPPLPWTEAIRISSSSTSSPSSDTMIDGKAFAVVNRMGVLCFDNDEITLSSDANIFNDRTAGNLVFCDNTPLFSVYKSAFFNDTISDENYISDKTSHLFLVQFDPMAKISYPLINSDALTDEDNSEVIDFVYNDDSFLCSIKTIGEYKNDFTYLSFTPSVPLLSLSPLKAKENILIKESDSKDFRKAKEMLPYSASPERIKKLLGGFSETLPFTLEVKTAGGKSPRLYQNKIEGSEEKDLQGKAILSQSWSGVLFEDGTLFLEGALPGKHILRGGKAIAIRLPKLPKGFVYSEFTISGTTLYAGWEESSFYKTGRSGFIQVDLDETLYKKLI